MPDSTNNELLAKNKRLEAENKKLATRIKALEKIIDDNPHKAEAERLRHVISLAWTYQDCINAAWATLKLHCPSAQNRFNLAIKKAFDKAEEVAALHSYHFGKPK